MTETTGAHGARPAKRIGEIKNNVVRTVPVAGNRKRSCQMIQLQKVPHTPGDEMIGARRVAAQPEAANDFLPRGVKRKSAAEYINAADLIANQRIIRCPEIRRRAVVGSSGVDWIAQL